MTAEATLEPGGIVWAKVTRITALDDAGNVIPGNGVFVTDALMKATITPVNEAGDAIAIKNASGNLGVFALKGDIPKWYTVALEMVYPDAQIEALITGGTLFSDDSEALGAPAAPTLAQLVGDSTLIAGTYVYRTASYTAYGRTTPSSEVATTLDGVGLQVIVTPTSVPADALGTVIYGRIAGAVQRLGNLANIGSQSTSAASGTGEVTELTVTALTKAIPAGTTFMIAGDTNSPNIVFTATETGAVGDTALAVSTSLEISTTIAAADILPVFVDDGSWIPEGVPNVTDLSGGPGIGVGQQSPVPGFANAQNLSLEFWMERILDGHQDPEHPWTWFVLPLCTYFVVGARDVTNAELQALYTGTAFPNPNWENAEFPFDASQILQWSGCGDDVVPEASYTSQASGA